MKVLFSLLSFALAATTIASAQAAPNLGVVKHPPSVSPVVPRTTPKMSRAKKGSVGQTDSAPKAPKARKTKKQAQSNAKPQTKHRLTKRGSLNKKTIARGPKVRRARTSRVAHRPMKAQKA